MLSLHPNEGVVLLGIVQIILGLVFISMAYIDRNFMPSKENLTRFQRSLLVVGAVVLTVAFFSIEYYLSLPEEQVATKATLKISISMMGILAIVYSYFIENTKVDRKLKRMTLYTYLTGKKISYFHLCLVGVGIVFVFLGYESIFV